MKARIKSQNGGQIFVSGDIEEIQKMKSILYYNLKMLNLSNSHALYERIASLDKIEYQLTTCGRVAIGFVPSKKTKDNLRSQWYTFPRVDLQIEFIFDIDLAIQLASNKEQLSLNKSQLRKDSSFSFDRYKHAIRNTSGDAIIIAPLFNIKFILDGNHRFANVSEEIVQAVIFNSNDTASIMNDPVQKEFYLILNEIIDQSNVHHS